MAGKRCGPATGCDSLLETGSTARNALDVAFPTTTQLIEQDDRCQQPGNHGESLLNFEMSNIASVSWTGQEALASMTGTPDTNINMTDLDERVSSKTGRVAEKC